MRSVADVREYAVEGGSPYQIALVSFSKESKTSNAVLEDYKKC